MTEDALSTIRTKIDKLDQTIFQALKERAQAACEVARIKRESADPVYYRPEREAQILRNIATKNDSLLPDRAVTQIFREILTACLALQKELSIAYLGPEGTFSQLAAQTHFGTSALQLPQESIERVFQAVESGHADYGIVPFENSIEGIVNMTLDAFLNSSLQICGEVEIPIHHHLLRMKETQKPITKLYSHSQSLGQCRQWIAAHLPNVLIIPTQSNGLAAQFAHQDPDAAAIAGQGAADHYGLEILEANIEDHPQNTTRFLVLGKESPARSGCDKTSLLIPTPHIPGFLFHLLKPFADRGINLTLLESRPYQHRNWSYLFFIDVLGHQEDEEVAEALAELEKMSILVTVLGSYPRVG